MNFQVVFNPLLFISITSLNSINILRHLFSEIMKRCYIFVILYLESCCCMVLCFGLEICCNIHCYGGLCAVVSFAVMLQLACRALSRCAMMDFLIHYFVQ